MKQSTLGSCIRTLRMQNNMTQAQLAAILGVTDKAVSKWERDLSYPDIALFPRIAEVLGITVDGLLGECTEDGQTSRLLKSFEMSRDIRTPLHIILGYVEIIRNNHDDPEMLNKYLDGIKISGEYMLNLFNRIQQEKGFSPDRETGSEDYPITSEELEKYLSERVSSDQNQIPAVQFTGKRVLVVEDMAINREIAAEILKQTGAETEFAEDGLICLEKIEKAPAGYYDLILMDIVMPNLNGIETARRIRGMREREKAEIPIIAMTTNVTEKDREAADAAGMNGFEEKPIFVDRLFNAMRQFLQADE